MVFLVFMYILFSLIAVLLTFVILIQDDQGDGIGGLFGGGGSSTAFGTRSGNVLTRFTGILAGMFFVICFLLGLMNRSPDFGDIKDDKVPVENIFFAPVEKERLEKIEAAAEEAEAGETSSTDAETVDLITKPFSGVLPPLP